MQFARDPLSLSLLRSQGVRAAGAAFVFQPVQHVVERPGELRDIALPGDRNAGARPEQIDPLHQRGDPSNGLSVARSHNALQTSMSAEPTVNTATSATDTGADTVSGDSVNTATAAIAMAALKTSNRQNSAETGVLGRGARAGPADPFFDGGSHDSTVPERTRCPWWLATHLVNRRYRETLARRWVVDPMGAVGRQRCRL